MVKYRKSYQGLTNIIRFNWHFYLLAILFFIIASLIAIWAPQPYNFFLYLMLILGLVSTLTSLFVSYFIYDRSNFYDLNWLKKETKILDILTINAGFDETSEQLQTYFPNSDLQIMDFYDENKHTEVSIERARRIYPSSEKVIKIATHHIPILSNSMDKIFLILAAHEIRNENERIHFLKEICRVVKYDGEIFIVEHLRDFPNFLAFNIGFLHFHSKKTWTQNFIDAQLKLIDKKKHTPFISIFKLTKNDHTV